MHNGDNNPGNQKVENSNSKWVRCYSCILSLFIFAIRFSWSVHGLSVQHSQIVLKDEILILQSKLCQVRGEVCLKCASYMY